MINAVIALVAAYLLGAFPSSYIIGRAWAKVDVRQEGDGHIKTADGSVVKLLDCGIVKGL